MSRFQQIRVRVEPVYKEGLASDFPNLIRVLSGLDNGLLDKDPPLWELTPLVERLAGETGNDSPAGKLAPRLEELGKTIRDDLGEWKLSAAETALNQLEDLFLELEAALGAE